MKVDNPTFDGVGIVNSCRECPFAGANGISLAKFRSKFDSKGCGMSCPDTETYAEACRLAESV